MAMALVVEGKQCIDCQSKKGDIELVKLKCKKHFICESCWDNRETCSEFEGKHRECQTCHPEVFQPQSPKVWIYVDDSNLWIEGKKAYAEAHNLVTSEDPRARFDIGQLNEVVAAGREVGGRTLYGSKPPPVDTVWAKIEEQGWKVDIKKKSYHTGKEKQVDSQLITDVASVVNRKKISTVIIVAGDVDYKPPIEEALARGWKVEVWSWEKALSADIRGHKRTGKGLRVLYLNHYIHQIMFVNCDFDPARFTDKGLLSRLKETSLLLTVSENNLQVGKRRKDFTDTLQNITKWPISYYEPMRDQDGYVEILAIFLSVMDQKPDINTCIGQIVKAKKQLSLTTNPMQFRDLLDKFGDKLVWLESLLSQCKQLNEECRDNASDTHSVHSSRSRRSSGYCGSGADPFKYKSELCRNYMKSSCSKGDKCKYAHGERDPLAWCLTCGKKGHVHTHCKRQVPID